jgi:hypothetical protein
MICFPFRNWPCVFHFPKLPVLCVHRDNLCVVLVVVAVCLGDRFFRGILCRVQQRQRDRKDI